MTGAPESDAPGPVAPDAAPSARTGVAASAAPITEDAQDEIRRGLARLRPRRRLKWTFKPTPDVLMTIFMRILSVAYLVFSIDVWAGMIGYGEGPFLADMTVQRQVLSIVFAILYPFVAVGLWMATSWGAVVWMLAASLRLVVDLGFIPGAPGNVNAALVSFTAIGLYLALSVWRVRGQGDPRAF